MKERSIHLTLADLSAGQWGLLTTKQAGSRGVSRAVLQHRERDGQLERILHGVYRHTGTPGSPLDEIRANWLTSNAGALAHERVRHPDVIVGGAAAAAVHKIGDLYPTPYLLYSSTRRQSERSGVKYKVRQLAPRDIAIVDGLPVTTVELTLADLVASHGDLSLVGDALRDASLAGYEIDTDHFAGLLAPLAHKYGAQRGDGAALYELLAKAAGVDAEATVAKMLAVPGVSEILVRRLMENTQLMESLASLSRESEATTPVHKSRKTGP